MKSIHKKILNRFVYILHFFLSQVTDELYRVHLTISKIRTHNASGDRMLDTSTPGQISTRTLRHLCETFRYQDKSAPQEDKSALVLF